jgi:hypothetical protein
VLRAVSAPAGRDNFGLGIHEAPHQEGVFVVNGIDAIGAEIAKLFYRWLVIVVIAVVHHKENVGINALKN